jgi:TolB-like protein
VAAQLGVVAWRWSGPVEAPAEAPAVAAVRGPSVFVVPFDALSAAEEDAFLAAGVTQALVSDLMRFPDFRLFSASESFSLGAGAAGEAVPGADYLLRGSVRSEDGEVAVGAQLLDARSGEVLWSEVYLRSLSPRDLLAIQAEVAAEVASRLGQPYGILRGEAASRGAAADPSMSSYACVLRAYDYRRTNEAAAYAPTRACLEAAVLRDPDYAEAWAMLAYLRLDAARFGYVEGLGVAEVYPEAHLAASRALALDPGNVQALKALSLAQFYAGRFDEAVATARRALELNPNDPDTLAQLGYRLAVRGGFAEGVPFIERAIERSVNPAPWYFLPVAIDRLMKSEHEAMLEAAERASVDGSAISQSLLAIAHARLGHAAEAERALAAMAERWPLLASDPAAAYASHQAAEVIVEALVAGLRDAGWRPPGE